MKGIEYAVLGTRDVASILPSRAVAKTMQAPKRNGRTRLEAARLKLAIVMSTFDASEREQLLRLRQAKARASLSR